MLDLKMAILCFFLISYSAVRANLIFEQPLFIGMLAQRTSIFSVLIFIVFTFFINEKLKNKPEVIYQSLKYFSWTYLFLWTFLSFSLNPMDYINTKLVDIRYTSGAYRFRFDEIPIVCGFCYYVANYFRNREYLSLFFSSLFLLYLIFIFQGRASLLVIGFILAIFYIADAIRKKHFHQLVILSFIGLISLPNLYTSLGFDQIFAVLGGDFRSVQDASSLSRIEAFHSILPDFKRNLISGVGYLSHQYKNGYEYFYGYYFPADLGIIGATHVYGILLVIIFNFSLLFYYFYNKLYEASLFLNMFFLYLFILSFQNAQFMLLIALPFILMNFMKVSKKYG